MLNYWPRYLNTGLNMADIRVRIRADCHVDHGHHARALLLGQLERGRIQASSSVFTPVFKYSN